ncbi:MAG: murein biosynthesis protein MurJ [Promicromonosporaceae bacterium]|nr:murein biosynthesis protein MurJ [Promicromonosporaceae bacterium]
MTGEIDMVTAAMLASAYAASAPPAQVEAPVAPAATPSSPTAQAAPLAPAKSGSLGRNSLILTIGTFASRMSGQVRQILLVAAIGVTGTVANAFDIANTLPNMLFALLAAGVLQAVLMPQIMQAIKAHDAQERLDKLLTIATAALVIGTAILVAAAPLLIRMLTLSGDWSPEARALAVVFGLWCIPQVLFYGLFSVLGEVLNARGQFAATGWAPMANNIVSVIGFGAFIAIWGRSSPHHPIEVATWTTAQTVLLAGTATLGIAAQSAILLVALRRGGFKWTLRFGMRGIGLRSAGKVVGWTLAAVALEQVGLIYLKNVTSAAGESGPGIAGNAIFSNALTIYLLPHSLVIVSIITALFPRMSMAAAVRDLDGVRSAMSTGLRSAGIFSIISAAVMIVFARPVLKSLLPTLAPANVDAAAPVLQALSVGLVALGATVMVKRMYFAFEDGRSIFVIQIFATASMAAAIAVAAATLDARYWTIAAAGAYSLSTWVSVLLRIRGMTEKLQGIDGPRVLRVYVRCAMAAVVAAAAGLGVARLLRASEELTWVHALLVTAVGATVMLGVYFVLLRALRVREVDDALRPVLRRLGLARKAPAAAAAAPAAAPAAPAAPARSAQDARRPAHGRPGGQQPTGAPYNPRHARRRRR